VTAGGPSLGPAVPRSLAPYMSRALEPACTVLYVAPAPWSVARSRLQNRVGPIHCFHAQIAG